MYIFQSVNVMEKTVSEEMRVVKAQDSVLLELAGLDFMVTFVAWVCGQVLNHRIKNYRTFFFSLPCQHYPPIAKLP